MHFPGEHPLFENRYDAGRQLADKLAEYKNRSAVVMAIPNGGVPVALGVALALEAELDLVISRKIPLPLSPEGGFGAVTDDGTTILNETAVNNANLSPQQIHYQVSKVRSNIRQRSLLHHRDRPPTVVGEKTVIINDDGLASGYTMRAAVESLRHRRPAEIVVAVPVGPAAVVKELEKVADRVITCAVGYAPKFYVSDFYRYWHETSDDEAIQCLREWRMRRFQANIDLPDKKAEKSEPET
jgi:predicted phosphoribosyltransferase